MEDGVPFCKHCGAPQIRVSATASDVPAPSESSEATGQIPALSPPSITATNRVEWAHALPGAALAGGFSLLALILLLAPLGQALASAGGLSRFVIFGPPFMAGGALSVALYRRRASDKFPSPSAGARIGAVSGGFGFLFPAILAIAALVYRSDEVRQTMMDGMAQASTRGYDPEKLQQMQQMLKTPEGLTFMIVSLLCVLLLIFVTGSSIGGALYAAWIRKRTLL